MSGHIPSFSSFPDFANEGQVKSKDRKEHKSRKEKHQSRKKLESSRRRRSRSRSPNESNRKNRHTSRRDEREKTSHFSEARDEELKAKEDRELASLEDRHAWSYFVDKRGDKMNIIYGGMHSGDIPKFHRTGKGKVLGLTSAWIIYRGTSSKELVVSLRHRPKAPSRYIESKSFRLLLEGPRQHMPVPTTPIPFQSEIIELPHSKKDRDPQDSYRSITLKDDQISDSEDSRSHSSASSDGELQLSLTADQETIKELENILSHSPDDETAWIKLWNISIKSVPKSMGRGSRAQAEISLSILRRAIDAHDSNRYSPRLRLLYIEHGAEIWSEDQIRVEWGNIMSELGDNRSPIWKRGVIWMAWLEWKLFSSRTVNEALVEAKKALVALSDDVFEMLRVRICWRMAVFLREAGFLEQAFSLLQAQVELSHFCPASLMAQPLSSRLDQLEEFWDSEPPRIGEDGAEGWEKWHRQRPDTVEYLHNRPDMVAGIEDPYQQWFCQEKALDHVGTLPARSFNEDETDPYSNIIFSDIKGFLFDMHLETAKEYLRLAFLSFIGLSIPGIGNVKIFEDSPSFDNGWMLSGRGGWISDPERLFPPVGEDRLITWESYAGTTVGTERPKKSGFGPVKEWAYSRSFLDGHGMACDGRSWEIWDANNIDIPLARRIIIQLAAVDRSDGWQEMLVALAGASDIKQGIKDSKKSLEQRPNPVHLWRCHAKLERIRNKLPEAAKVYNMSLSIDPQSSELPLLVADGVEFFWLRDEQLQAQTLLTNYLGIQGVLSSLNLLRARKDLDARMSHYKEADKQWEACLRLRFFVELASAKMEECISVIDSLLAGPHVSRQTHEAISMWLCLTIFSISRIPGSMTPPTLVRDRVSISLALYPRNTVLLGLFLECERGYGIWGRVRNLLDSGYQSDSIITGEKPSLLRVAWDIWAENWGYGPWETERVRNKLENAVNTAGMKQSVVLWQIYLSFELRVKSMERAKIILLRALGNCPWAKGLYMMAAGPLRPMFQTSELNDLVATMVERGIRMRRDVGELLEGWFDPDTAHDEGDQPMGDAELEVFMHDREQAKPF